MTATINCKSVLAVIPARFPSQRLPGKPLKDINGKTLIERVWRQANKAGSLSRVIIASDDQNILDTAKAFGAEVLLTSNEHLTGTDRVAEVARVLAGQGQFYQIVVNVQGDMPFISPNAIDSAVQMLLDSSPSTGMSTIAVRVFDEAQYQRADSVKVVLGEDQHALYFSRAPVPHYRDQAVNRTEEPLAHKHIGLYVYRAETLERLSRLPEATVERAEKLEQLRALAHGIKIKVALLNASEAAPAIEVDTLQDLERAREAAVEFDLRPQA